MTTATLTTETTSVETCEATAAAVSVVAREGGKSADAGQQDIDQLTGKLARRQSLNPAEVDADTRLAVALLMIRKAGTALAPTNRNATSVIKALGQLEELAVLTPGQLTRNWLALRALELRPGDAVGGSLLREEVTQAFIDISGFVPTLDEEEEVAGVVGDWNGEKFAARARRAMPGHFASRPFEVARIRVADAAASGGAPASTSDSGAGDSGAGASAGNEYNAPTNSVTHETLLIEDAGQPQSAADLLKEVSKLPSRYQSSARARVNNSIKPMDYQVIDQVADSKMAGETLFEAYRPQRLAIPGAVPHPSPLVEPAALASVLPPVPTYRPHLDDRIIQQGVLSDVQLEGVVYAGQAHEQYLESDPDNPNRPAPRRAFFVGHGTGVGKGRLITGILRDNWNQGRRRAVWVTEQNRLMKACQRDWIALGGKASDLFDLRSVSAGSAIPQRNGILVTTYAALRGETENSSRVRQVAEWLGLTDDNPVVFDEVHNLRNAFDEEGTFGIREGSKQGKAGLALQDSLPNARVVYVSATGATDIASLGFATRLGLWGRGTAFPTANAFFQQMFMGGLNALEMVARDLKSMGLYVACTLSYEGVEYDRLEYRLSPAERAMQDKLAECWAKVNDGLQRALHHIGVMRNGKGVLGAKNRGLHMAQFSSAKQRFFQAFLASIKMGPVLDAIEKDLQNGDSVLVQLTNTYEATLNRALANAQDPDYGDVDATPRDTIIQYLENIFPVHQYRMVKRGPGVRSTLQLVVDASGNPVEDPNAVAERDRLIAEVQQLALPEGPLEQLLDRFGPELVAEVTGRRRRLVPKFGGGRELEERTQSAVSEDIRLFQAGVKRILTFSPSGGAGDDYHASKHVHNQSRRVHYLVQVGWRADVAMQGMGRSHRSNQVCPPRYVLVQTDLWADRRSLSTIANRMQSMGAITRGMRHAASQGFFTSEDNLEGPLTRTAWRNFLNDLDAGKITALTLKEFEFETGIKILDHKGRLREDLPEVTRFLNQMAGMTCAKQEQFGAHFKAHLDAVRLDAIRDGSYDRGIETISPDSLIKLEDQIVYRDPRSGAETRLAQLLRRDTITPMSFDEAAEIASDKGAFRFVQSILTSRVSCVIFPKKGVQLDATTTVTRLTPRGTVQLTAGDIWKERVRMITLQEAQSLWDAELASLDTSSEGDLYVITGTLLPIWDKLPRERITVYRMETDDGERILGRVIPETAVERLIKRFDAIGGSGMDPKEVLEGLEKGEIATLDNGWILQGEPNLIKQRTEITLNLRGDDGKDYKDQMSADGLIPRFDILNQEFEFLLPEDPNLRQKAWDKLIRHRKIVGMTSMAA